MLLLLFVAPFTILFYRRLYLEVILCRKHLWINRLSLAASWVLIIASFFVFVLSVSRWSLPIYVLSLLMVVGGFVLGLTLGTAVTIRKLNGDLMWIGRVGKSFLSTLPELPAS
jgi:hypothetical protein